jgi:hypothetical protein
MDFFNQHSNESIRMYDGYTASFSGNVWKYCKKAAMGRDLREFFIKFGHANIHNFIYLQLYIFVISLTILSY